MGAIWSRFKIYFEAAHNARFAYEIIQWVCEWLGYDHPIKALFVWGPPMAWAGYAMISRLNMSVYQIWIVGAVVFALSGIGANAWAAARTKINQFRTSKRDGVLPDSRREEPTKSHEHEPDIDAREAFFQILERSQWREKQLANSPDPMASRVEWLKVRLETEIHNYLAQGKLKAWGELSLPRGTGPLREISREQWDEIKILFDQLNHNVPRTIAKWRRNDRASYFGIMFSKEEVFQLFPLVLKPNGWKPIYLAVEHISQKTGDTDTKNFWPSTRRL
jgi:hypothetical protein